MCSRLAWRFTFRQSTNRVSHKPEPALQGEKDDSVGRFLELTCTLLQTQLWLSLSGNYYQRREGTAQLLLNVWLPC